MGAAFAPALTMGRAGAKFSGLDDSVLWAGSGLRDISLTSLVCKKAVMHRCETFSYHYGWFLTKY